MARQLGAQYVESLGLQQIAPERGQPRRLGPTGGLFHQPGDGPIGTATYDAIFFGVFSADFHYAQNGASALDVGAEGTLLRQVAPHHIIGQKHNKGLVPDRRFGTKDRMAKSQRGRLTQENSVRALAHGFADHVGHKLQPLKLLKRGDEVKLT